MNLSRACHIFQTLRKALGSEESFPTRYIFACDDHGNTRWPSPLKTWTLGGFIIPLWERQAIIDAWAKIKEQLCGDPTRELKWSHFFLENHRAKENHPNPLRAYDPQVRRELAKWAILELLRVPGVRSLTTVVRKDLASAAIFITTPDGRQVLDISTLWVGVLGQFALFLEEHRATGEIWCDQLGSRVEETRRQSAWEQLRDGPWPFEPQHQTMMRRIVFPLKFLDSKTEPLIQIADFLSGVIRAASEGDSDFLAHFIEQYFPTGPHTYMLLHVE